MPGNAGVIWIKLATIYFVIGVGWGIYMGASGDHSLFPVHAHINLLGWVSLALIGLIYRQFPGLATTRLAKIQFWLYNLPLPFLLLALTGLLRGNTALEPVVGIGSAIVGVAVVLFAVNIFRNLKAPAS
ncbi:hypothetical protein [Dokdonella soli]|uniref:Cytochrome-c oxidase n=1 Tax=Dokdonella soli TaxID=529810 RepID=A0ABN1IYG2_9GAMM